MSRLSKRIGLFVLLAAATALPAKELAWKSIDVRARLDEKGALHVVETQTMVFDGDWNGGERVFRVLPGQSFALSSLTRIAPDGTRHLLTEGGLAAVDEWGWAGENILRWRSRLPTDPEFSNTEIVYELAYTLSGVLVKQGGRSYLLDHDFAFPNREWPIRGLKVSLELHPDWKPRDVFSGSWTSGVLEPGASFVVRVPLEYAGSGEPVAATGFATPGARRVLLGILAAVIAFAYFSWRRRETALGRFAPLTDPEKIDEAWLEKHLLSAKPEEVGALWDEKIGPPEVAAVLARLAAEKKIATEASGKTLTMRLLVPVGDFDGYDRQLVEALFFGGRKETDTDEIKKHYKSRGFDPASKIRPGLEKELEKRGELRDKSPAPSPWPAVLLLAGAMLCHGYAVLTDTEELGQAIGTVITFGLLFAIGAGFAWAFRKRVQRLDAASPLILWVPALIFAFAWLGTRESVRTSLVVVVGTMLLRMAVIVGLFDLAKTRSGPRRIARRKELASARAYFQRELKSPAPRLSDDWFPYVLAFGLTSDADRWFRAHGAAASTAAATASGGSGGGSRASSSSSRLLPRAAAGPVAAARSGARAPRVPGPSRRARSRRACRRRRPPRRAEAAVAAGEAAGARAEAAAEAGEAGSRLPVESPFVRESVTIVGAGLAGSECAWQLARRGHRVRVLEMRPKVTTSAHQTDRCAELVCSNSFRSDNPRNAVGLIKREMEALDSLVIRCARQAAVPAGDALAMDRHVFAGLVTEAIAARPEIELLREEVTAIPAEGFAVIATGPLTSPALDRAIGELLGTDDLYFYDSMAPILEASSLDFSKMYALSRYGKGEGADYWNCPLSREEYERFLDALLAGETVPIKDFEKGVYFEGCLPIEVMAQRGRETLRHGPMKPMGLTDPRTGRRPWAVVQLRQDDLAKEHYNIVGFQTKLKIPEQQRIFRTIPGLENASFARYGMLHRNTYIHAPAHLDRFFRMRREPRIYFAGQITGVEGYVESAATGLAVGLAIAQVLEGREPVPIPYTTAIGSLARHCSERPPSEKFEPMNVTFGLIEDTSHSPVRDKQVRRQMMVDRALSAIAEWKEQISSAAAVVAPSVVSSS